MIYNFYYLNKERLSGFTLVETIITIGISAMALLALTNLFLSFNSLYSYQQSFMMVTESSGTSMNAFESAVLPANNILASHTFDGTPYTSTTTTLVLEVPTVDSSGNVVPSAKDYVVFYVSAPYLYQLTEADATSARPSGLKTLSSTLGSISFTYDNIDFAQATSVIVDITTQAVVKQRAIQNRLQEKLYLRNMEPPL